MAAEDVKFTNKAPALIVGLALLLFGALGLRKSLILGAVLITIGAAFVGYSLTIKEWCAVVNPQSAFSSGFAPSFHGCLQMKGWLEF